MKIYFEWTANSDPNVTGYKIYAGNSSGAYNHPNSPRDVGNVTTGFFDVRGYATTADTDSPMYFALTAYTATEESGFSTEIQRMLNRPVTLFRR